MLEATPPPVYRTTLTSSVGTAMLAALLVGGIDVALTLSQSDGVRPAQAFYFAGIALVLYLATGALIGLLEGTIAGAIRATHPGAGFFSRLRRDPAFDREVTGWLLAALVAGAVFAGAVAVLAIRLVAIPERKSVGALLLGGAAAALVPIVILLAYPAYRVTRRLAPLVPRLGAIPRAAVAVLLVAGVAVAGGAFVAVTRLDWRALPLAAPLLVVAFFVAQALLGRLRPLRGRLVALVGAAAVAIAAVTVAAADVDERTAALLAVESRGARILVGAARRFFDRDQDGYATVLGGADCDDANPEVHPGARDVPDNGVDENCLGGDAKKGGVAVAGPRPEPATTSGPRWDGNILVVVVDTVRADRLGVAGYLRAGKSLTPRIDALAKDGVRFTHAYAQAPNTPRSFPSIMTSRLPSQIAWGSDFHNFPPLNDENLTMFEVLRDAGLHTAGFASHFYFSAGRGATQGFLEFDNEGAKTIADSNTDIASPRIVPRAVARMKQLGAEKKRFAMMVHLFEPHSRYVEHEEFPIQSKGVEGLEEKYDYEIAFVDRWVGELVDGLAAAGVAGDTMVVLLSDHGEAFGAHKFGGERMFFHGQTLYDELLRVPLIFHAPGLPARTVDSRVMLIDVAPTLAELVGVTPPPMFLGRSLRPALTGEALPPRPITAEVMPAPSWKHDLKMLIGEDDKKIIYRISDGVFELYDLAADPGELANLAAGQPDLLARMKERITRWMETEL